MSDPSSWVILARVIRPQGRRGEVLAEILTDFPERFTGLREACLRRSETSIPAPVALEEAWLHKNRVVLKFASVDSISDAELLRGAEVVVPLPARVQLEEGAAYIDDLIGCQLMDVQPGEAKPVGTVRDVIQQPQSTDLLVVVDGDGTEHWIPFARDHLVRMDLENRRIEMCLPPGLLDINAPLSEEERQWQQSEDSADTRPPDFDDLPRIDNT